MCFCLICNSFLQLSWVQQCRPCLFAQGSQSCCQSGDVKPLATQLKHYCQHLQCITRQHWPPMTKPVTKSKQNKNLADYYFAIMVLCHVRAFNAFIFPLKFVKSCLTFSCCGGQIVQTRGVWMNIRCISTMQSGNTMHGPPEDAGKWIVRIKGNVEHSRTRDLRA